MLNTLPPLDASQLIKEEQVKPISSLMFLKQKQDGKIKGWACTNGRP